MKKLISSTEQMLNELTDLYVKITDKLSQTEDLDERARLIIAEERLSRQSEDILVAIHGENILKNPCPIKAKKYCWRCTGYHTKGSRSKECDKDDPRAVKCPHKIEKPHSDYFLDEKTRVLNVRSTIG